MIVPYVMELFCVLIVDMVIRIYVRDDIYKTVHQKSPFYYNLKHEK